MADDGGEPGAGSDEMDSDSASRRPRLQKLGLATRTLALGSILSGGIASALAAILAAPARADTPLNVPVRTPSPGRTKP